MGLHPTMACGCNYQYCQGVNILIETLKDNQELHIEDREEQHDLIETSYVSKL